MLCRPLSFLSFVFGLAFCTSMDNLSFANKSDAPITDATNNQPTNTHSVIKDNHA
jgi:hypothetical protein